MFKHEPNLEKQFGQQYLDILKEANNGQADALYSLGNMYSETMIRIRNSYINEFGKVSGAYHLANDRSWTCISPKEMVKQCYELAAEKGHAGAMFELGRFYHNGYEDSKDYANALKWYKKAEKLGNTDVYYWLASIYWNRYNRWEENDIIKAYNYMLKAAQVQENKENVLYRYCLGEICLDCLECEKIPQQKKKEDILKEAEQYFLKAYSLSLKDDVLYKDILEKLVQLYLGHYGNEKNLEKAWFYGQEAVEQKSGYAAFLLAKELLDNDLDKKKIAISYLNKALEYKYPKVEEVELLLYQYGAWIPRRELQVSQKDILDLSSDFYYGHIDKKDRVYVAEYIRNQLEISMNISESQGILTFYKEILTLLKWVTYNGRIQLCVHSQWSYKIISDLSEVYMNQFLDGTLTKEYSDMIEKASGMPELDYRRKSFEELPERIWIHKDSELAEKINVCYPEFLVYKESE